MTFSTAVFAAPTFINITTGGTSLGVGLSDLRTRYPGRETSVQATKASVENLNLLQAGRGELALALGDSVADAWNRVADAGFKPLKKLRAIGNTYPNYIQVVASQASGIKTLADLKASAFRWARPKRYRAERPGDLQGRRPELRGHGQGGVPAPESVELIKNRQLDATLQSSGLGMAAIRDLASTMPITFVAIPADVVAKIDSPAYHAASIPAGTYDGQEQDVPTVAIDNILVSHSGVSDELAYQMTKLMFDNLPRLVTAHAAAKDIALDKAAKNLPIPLHPGAERFYKEKGVLPE